METKTLLPSLSELPESYAIIADNLKAISVTGEESAKYLQGQLTCNVTQLEEKKLLVGGHCDAKGKMFSAFRLINHNNRALLIQSEHSLPASLSELQKFGVFAKVTIEDATDLGFLALVGEQARQFLMASFHALPDSFNPVISENGMSVIYLTGDKDRYLIVASKTEIKDIVEKIELPTYSKEVWALSEISSGFPHMNPASVREYVPQMLNLQLINGICFTKGCYLGQETVARMKYLGKNKRALFALTGTGTGTAEITAESVLEKQLGENFRRAGNVIAHYQSDDGQVYIQAVLASDTEDDSVFRIKGQDGVNLSLMPLPYTLTENDD